MQEGVARQLISIGDPAYLTDTDRTVCESFWRGMRVASAIRYAAFISYSHTDSGFARWLHRAIESYAIPKTLVGRETDRGVVPRRLTPVFRDRDELSASSSLSAAVEAALAAADHLVVIGSPAAARSRWVNAEVQAFKRAHGEDRVIAAILSGEPASADDDECFPPSLRLQLGANGALSDVPAEPIAADFRPGKDGKRLALLKIISCLAGVRLDELVQREAHRRHRRLAAAAAASIAGMAVTSGLAVAAVQARYAADRQRAQAEGLVEFMLTDLRGRLEPVGRLDALDVVGARAVKFYAGQRAGDLDSDALGRRSRALHLIGEVATLRGDLGTAQRIFGEAAASTAEQLRRHPNDPQRIYDQAQSVFWVGNTAWQRGDLPAAERSFVQYRVLADRLVRVGGPKPDWLAEIDYANSNLGTVLMDRGRFAEARQAFLRSLAVSQRLLKAEPQSEERIMSTAQSLAWLADAEAQSGQLKIARQRRNQEIALYDRVLAIEPRHVGARRSRAHAESEQARFALVAGAVDEASSLADGAARRLEAAIAIDPDNADMQSFRISPLLIKAEADLARGRIVFARNSIGQAATHLERLREINSSPKAWRDLSSDVALTSARLALAERDSSSALTLIESARRGDSCVPRRGFRLALKADALEGDALAMSGDRTSARAAWQRALDRARRCGGASEPEAAADFRSVVLRMATPARPRRRA